MSTSLTTSSTVLLRRAVQNITHTSTSRAVSSSPYGRTHVWKRRPPKLPNPVVPMFPQRVYLADGSTFLHWTTSPRSTIRLTKDTTNSAVWNPWLEAGNTEDLEGQTTGRLGRFRRKFEDLGGTGVYEEFHQESDGPSQDPASTSEKT
ncbi:hypothetical protein BD410DRAFT_836020 [Rickenella mellea]|uniref:50S ribosomal protein L31, chloroplastic n=1 Tax=Rickenella mellea TaxID=50990 RepID=A0A4Y7QJA8_9AGAM|nr:hypothetical protein BD410DRAFT_836020 [Rickenella mellea]